MKVTHLTPACESHIEKFMHWFTTEKAIVEWAGPNFRYPFTKTSFVEDLAMDNMKSFVLLSDNEDVIGFGQYYRRIERCHIARLVVNPLFRKQGYGVNLISLLSKKGLKELALSELSLFVLADNQNAINVYQNLGFEVTRYPHELPLDNCMYMVNTNVPTRF